MIDQQSCNPCRTRRILLKAFQDALVDPLRCVVKSKLRKDVVISCKKWLDQIIALLFIELTAILKIKLEPLE